MDGPQARANRAGINSAKESTSFGPKNGVEPKVVE